MKNPSNVSSSTKKHISPNFFTLQPIRQSSIDDITNEAFGDIKAFEKQVELLNILLETIHQPDISIDRVLLRIEMLADSVRSSSEYHIDLMKGHFRTLQRQQKSRLKTMNDIVIATFETNIPGLGKTTFPEFFQFLSEEARKGRFWTLTDNLTDRCLFMTDNAEPERLIVPVTQYIGVDFRHYWRDSLDEYERLKYLLATEKVAPSFEYDLYRFDNSLARYQQTYYLIEGLWNGQIRASVSEGWELL